MRLVHTWSCPVATSAPAPEKGSGFPLRREWRMALAEVRKKGGTAYSHSMTGEGAAGCRSSDLLMKPAFATP